MVVSRTLRFPNRAKRAAPPGAGRRNPLRGRRRPERRRPRGCGTGAARALGPFGESAKVASSVEQVVDELASCRFFLPYCEPLSAFVAFGKGVDHLVDGCQSPVRRGGEPGPDGKRSRQMPTDQGAQPVAGLRCSLAQCPPGVELVPGRSTSSGGDLREDRRCIGPGLAWPACSASCQQFFRSTLDSSPVGRRGACPGVQLARTGRQSGP